MNHHDHHHSDKDVCTCSGKCGGEGCHCRHEQDEAKEQSIQNLNSQIQKLMKPEGSKEK